MKIWSTFVLAGCIALGMSLALTKQWVGAQGTQPNPVEPQQNDRRAPIARVNPKKPIQIRVVSQASVPVVATTIVADGDRLVAPGKTVTFGRLHTSYLPLPLDLQITLRDTPDPEKPIRVFLNVQTAGNEVIVNVRTGFTGVGNSSQTISLDEAGRIYVF
jgi:hypothetical protein